MQSGLGDDALDGAVRRRDDDRLAEEVGVEPGVGRGAGPVEGQVTVGRDAADHVAVAVEGGQDERRPRRAAEADGDRAQTVLLDGYAAGKKPADLPGQEVSSDP
jgi:hypothetical protein